MTIELNHYGFTFDTAWCYVALSWQLLTTATIIAAATYAYRLWRTSQKKM